MQDAPGITPSRKKSAITGVVVSVTGLIILFAGTYLLRSVGNTYTGLAMIIFGILLSITAVLVFVLPAAYEYLREEWKTTP